MHATLVHVRVKPEHVDDFIRATLENHRGSVAEPGNRRFDMLQQGDDPCAFILYEVYASAEDAAAHKRTPHYLAWRERVEPWMAQPRRALSCRALAPERVEDW